MWEQRTVEILTGHLLRACPQGARILRGSSYEHVYEIVYVASSTRRSARLTKYGTVRAANEELASFRFGAEAAAGLWRAGHPNDCLAEKPNLNSNR